MPAEDALRSRAAASLASGANVHREVAQACAGDVARAALAVAATLRAGGKVLTFGNGGSAADAQHLAAELVGRFVAHRPALAGIALTTDTSALTAISNDYGFEHVFARQLEGLGRPGDVAIAISTSGSSPNVLAGVEAARAGGMTTIALTGGQDSPVCGMVDIAIVVRSGSTARVQEGHLALEHVLCECVESLLFPEEAGPPVEAAATGAVGRSAAPAPAASKVVGIDELLAEREAWRREGRTVVWTNGCFDLVHVGHLLSLEAARRLGDVLVVGLNDDQAVRHLKGDGRPVVPAPERAALVAALEAVSRVVLFPELTPEVVLRRLQPDVHCKGIDYAPPDGKSIPELATVQAYGGRVEFLPLVESVSTSSLINKVRASSPI
jgi:phosphoheptose isomerase